MNPVGIFVLVTLIVVVVYFWRLINKASDEIYKNKK